MSWKGKDPEGSGLEGEESAERAANKNELEKTNFTLAAHK